ncbi:hypothetical protein [Streptomyces xinghaiensis]|nr:hypothetical protein [Streptomyces xinghaiensis]
MITGYKAARNRPLTGGQKLSNKALAAVRALLVLTNKEVAR